MILSMCDSSSLLKVFYFVNSIKTIVFILVPVFLIIVTMYSLFKTITTNDEEKNKRIIANSIKKIIIAASIFFVPVIVNIVLSLINTDSIEMFDSCMEKATFENIEYIREIEKVEVEIEKLKVRPTKENLESAEEAVQAIIEKIGDKATVADKEILENFQYSLAETRTEVDNIEQTESCALQGGTLKDGVCILPDLTPKPDSDSSSGGTAKCGDTSKMVNYTFNGNSYLVIDSKVSVKSFVQFIKEKDLKQETRNKTYGGMCLSFSYAHAYSLYTGSKSMTLQKALKYPNASKFKAYENDSKAKVLEKACNELVNNRPVILQVNGNKNGTSRHYVTVVGFKKSVASSGKLSEGDVLIIDSRDGKVEGLKPVGSRFMTTGKKCRKKYSGYQLYYIKK